MVGVRRNIHSGSPLEPVLGFSRAVRIGNIIAVSGTAPIGENGKTVAPGDVSEQTRACIEIALEAMREAGAGLENVIRTRIMLTDAANWEEAGRVHGEVFGKVGPACTVVEVKGFIDPEWLVEVEMDAVIGP